MAAAGQTPTWPHDATPRSVHSTASSHASPRQLACTCARAWGRQLNLLLSFKVVHATPGRGSSQPPHARHRPPIQRPRSSELPPLQRPATTTHHIKQPPPPAPSHHHPPRQTAPPWTAAAAQHPPPPPLSCQRRSCWARMRPGRAGRAPAARRHCCRGVPAGPAGGAARRGQEGERRYYPLLLPGRAVRLEV